jgi:lysophospholipase L1-like esterase
MKITCLGDSFTEGFLVDKNYTRFLQEAGFDVENLGINGDTTGQMLKRFVPQKTDILLVFGGSNDFFCGVGSPLAYKNIKSILEKSKASKNLVVIPPYVEEEEAYCFYEQVNLQIDDLAKLLEKDGIETIDARKINPQYLDGVHMGEIFHKKLADRIIDKIKETYA